MRYEDDFRRQTWDDVRAKEQAALRRIVAAWRLLAENQRRHADCEDLPRIRVDLTTYFSETQELDSALRN